MWETRLSWGPVLLCYGVPKHMDYNQDHLYHLYIFHSLPFHDCLSAVLWLRFIIFMHCIQVNMLRPGLNGNVSQLTTYDWITETGPGKFWWICDETEVVTVFLLYYAVHPSVTDYRKRNKMQDGTQFCWLNWDVCVILKNECELAVDMHAKWLEKFGNSKKKGKKNINMINKKVNV